MVMVLCTSKIVFAENQIPSTSKDVAPTTNIIPTPTPKPNDITVNPLYTTLLSKNDIKNSLILKENQICKDIKEQENINNKKVTAIIEKSHLYSMTYNKIIDDIKLLLDPIKVREILYYKELTQNKTDTQITGDTSNTISVVNKEASLYDNQISNLNLAIKAMRESMKYISLESVEYHKKLETVQKNIDKINPSIEELSKEIIADKISKEKEWNNFCSAMVKGDLKAANESFDNLIKSKEHIIQNYSEILKYKKSIEEQLVSLEATKK